VEAGAHSINPIITERTIVNIQSSKMDKKVERWNRISEAAAKQSGRSRIPVVSYPMEFREALTKPKGAEPSAICYVKEDSLTLKDLLRKNIETEVLNIFIGPEGGFTVVEWEKARMAGLSSISLGKRILKAETAGFFVTVAAMYEYGELDRKD
jgi:16S rRNA (uracil1498-N3)-methyltransferase